VPECRAILERYDQEVAREVAGDELTQTEELYTASEGVGGPDGDGSAGLHVTEDGVVLRRPPRTGAAAIKRRSGNRR